MPRRKRRDDYGVPPMAVKIVKKDDIITIQNVIAIENEIRILKAVSPHRNVVKFVEVLHGPTHIYIIMERMERDLFTFMEENKSKIDQNIAALITKEILSGVAHLTQHRVVHRDIKPENVLIDVTTNDILVKLGDFGHSRQLMEGESTLTNDFAGSPGFYAPEAVVTNTYDAFKADVYSVMCVTLEMLVSVDFFESVWMPPFRLIKCHDDTGADEKHDFYLKMRASMLAAHREVDELYSAPGDGVISEFVRSVIHMQPELRPSVTALLNAGWLSRANKASACDKLLDREHLHEQYRRFSYLPPDTTKSTIGSMIKCTAFTAELPALAGNKGASRACQQRAPSSSAGSSTTLSIIDSRISRRRSSAYLRDNGLGSMNVNSAELARQAAERRESFLTCNVESASFREKCAAAHQAKKEMILATNRAEALANLVSMNPLIEDSGSIGGRGKFKNDNRDIQRAPYYIDDDMATLNALDKHDELQFVMDEGSLTDREDVSPPESRFDSRNSSFC